MKVLVLILTIATSALAGPVSEHMTSSNTTFKLSATPNLRIINGQNAALEQFPYQISFQFRAVSNWRHICGGSIIGRNYVLTAGHCIPVKVKMPDYRIVAGITNLNGANLQESAISDIIVHELFPGGPIVAPHDIALICLSTLLNWTPAVQPIGLTNPGHISVGTATLSGWGAIDGAGTVMPNALKFADLPVVANLECNSLLNTILNNRPHPFDFESNLCTGSFLGYQSACGGDSGGPLVKNGHLIGVVSWGITPCGSVSNAPTVYARVANYVTWIQQKATDLQE